MAHERDSTPTHRHDRDDTALVDAARRDRAAFGALYDRHVDRVFAYAMRRLRDRELAADATANAFTRALASFDRFQPDGDNAFARWLMTIARNAVVDVVRERRGTVALDMDALARQRAASGSDPARRLPPDDRRQVETAIDALGSPQREIVVLRLQGWTGTSGAAALSPDGATVAYLAPSDRPGLRHLTVQEVASGAEITGRPIDATYSNSLMFTADGEYLYATYGSTLERIDLDLANGFAPAHSLIELPDTGYQIVGVSPDRTKLLLDRAGSTPGDSSLWVDLDTGELRKLPGQPSNLYIEGIPGVSRPVARYVSLDEPGSPSGDRAMGVVDMDTGEIVISGTRADISLVSVSADGSTLLIPSDDGITVWSATGGAATFPAPQDVERASTMFSLSPNGACAAGSWDLDGDAVSTVLLVAETGEQLALPESLVPGWVLADDP